MGASNGRTDNSVEQALFTRGYEFEFFQAVRLLSWICPRRRDVGGTAKPGEEVAWAAKDRAFVARWQEASSVRPDSGPASPEPAVRGVPTAPSASA